MPPACQFALIVDMPCSGAGHDLATASFSSSLQSHYRMRGNWHVECAVILSSHGTPFCHEHGTPSAMRGN